jgi:hypothetical protein
MKQAKKGLRLGPLPKTEVVKLAVSLNVALKADLDRYAALHSQTYGEPVDAATLIPHMLEAFMARDREFKTARDDRPTDEESSNASLGPTTLS